MLNSGTAYIIVQGGSEHPREDTSRFSSVNALQDLLVGNRGGCGRIK